MDIIVVNPCFWVGVLAGGLGASPQELNVTEYEVSLPLGSIELGGSADIIASPSRATKPRFWSVRLGES